jgi:hypothetical protein
VPATIVALFVVVTYFSDQRSTGSVLMKHWPRLAPEHTQAASGLALPLSLHGTGIRSAMEDNADVRKCSRKDRATTSTEDEPKRTQEFRTVLPHFLL